MAELPDHYTTLGVRSNADTAQIRRAWIRAARANHPDRRGDVGQMQGERSDRRMRAVNEAWRVLGSEEARSAYDAERFAEQSPPTDGGAPQAQRGAREATSGAGMADGGTTGAGDIDDPWSQERSGTTTEPGGPGGFVVSHRGVAIVVRVLPWVAIATVGIVIFVASAYMTANNDVEQSKVAALEVGECFWIAPEGTLRTVGCEWPQNDGVLDEIVTRSPSNRCRHPDAVLHDAPIAGRRLCLVPVDLWKPPTPP